VWCCGQCFDDRFLAEDIRHRSTRAGTCDFCGADGEALVCPDELADHFELLASTYEVDVSGGGMDTIAVFRKDWELFSRLDDSVAQQLLEQISQAIPHTGLVRPESKPSIEHWRGLRTELMHVNRFFPKSGFGDEEARLLEYLIADRADIPKDLYRARILHQSEPFTVTEMGKPPSEIASHGRANPHGISCLYVADEIDTTIAEVRPHKGDKVCIASIRPVGDLKLIDLCSPEKGISPFGLEEDDVRLLAGMIPYLRHLGEELSRPISPNRTHLEYLPTQYLCEFIKGRGHDGVIYKSSVGEGLNYAIFDDSAVSFDENIDIYEVTNVNFGSRLLKT